MNAILNNRFFNLLVNMLIRLRILLFRTNGHLRLDYHWKRRVLMLNFRTRKTKPGSHINMAELERKSKAFLSANFNGYKDASWTLLCARLNGIADHRYIPEDIYYDIIEKKLNHPGLILAYKDKNIYERLFPSVKLPVAVARIMNRRLYDSGYAPICREKLPELFSGHNELALKPSIDSGGGRNVIIEDAASIARRVDKILDTPGDRHMVNYVIQSCLQQHAGLARFHPQSINTLRTMTMRLNHEIVHLSSFLRMGRNNIKVDNLHSGGILCGVDEKGRLRKYGYDYYFDRLEQHPDTGIRFEGEIFPYYKEAMAMVKDLHKTMFYFDIISWDVSIDPDNQPCLVEMNLYYQGFNHHQVANGPLFSNNTARALAILNHRDAIVAP